MNLDKYIGREFDPEEWNCWLLCQTVLRNGEGIIVPTFQEYYSQIYKYKSLSEVFEHERKQKNVWKIIEPGQEKKFDIVLIRMRSFPIHAGIVTWPGWMLHVEQDVETVHEEYTRLKWKQRVLGIYRHEHLFA